LEALSKHAEQWTSNNVQDDFRTFIWRNLLVGTQQPRALATVQIAEYLTESYEIEGHTRVTFVSLETASDYVGLWRTCKQELEQFQYEMRLWVLRNQNRPWFVSVAPYTGLQTIDCNRTDGWPDLAYAEYHLVADDAEARKQSLREYAEIASTNVDQFWANFQVLTQAWHRWIEELRDTHDRRNTDMCARAKMLLTDIPETPLQPPGYDEWKGWLKVFFFSFTITRERWVRDRQRERAEMEQAQAESAASAQQQPVADPKAEPVGESGGAIPSESQDTGSGAIPGSGSSSSGVAGAIPASSANEPTEEVRGKAATAPPPTDQPMVRKSPYAEFVERIIRNAKDMVGEIDVGHVGSSSSSSAAASASRTTKNVIHEHEVLIFTNVDGLPDQDVIPTPDEA
jgi:hypothetical protein